MDPSPSDQPSSTSAMLISPIGRDGLVADIDQDDSEFIRSTSNIYKQKADATIGQFFRDLEEYGAQIVINARERSQRVREKAAEDARHIREEVENERRLWEEQKRRFEEVFREQQSTIVDLNVGGRTFTTSSFTLSGESGSMLAAMFSGRFTNKRDQNGRIFIDRDGERFQWILNWLRDEQLDPSLDENARRLLLREAEYFQLDRLKATLEDSLGITADVNAIDDNDLIAPLTRNFIKHDFQITSCVWCMQCTDTTLILGHSDGQITVWSLEDNSIRMQRRLEGHTEGVRHIYLHGTTLASGSSDSSIRLWDLTSGSNIKTLTGHSDAVRCIQFVDNVLVSGSNDKTIKIWDLDTSTCRRTLMGHSYDVYVIEFRDNVIISGSKDKTVKIWNMHDGQCLRTISGFGAGVRCLQMRDSVVATGEYSGGLKVFDIETGNQIKSIPYAHSKIIKCIEVLSPHVILTGGYDHFVKLWDLRSSTCVKHWNFEKYVEGIHTFNDTLVVGGGKKVSTFKFLNETPAPTTALQHFE